MQIVFDDIIYSLQNSGGVSVYWTEIIKRIDENACHYIYDNAQRNIFYNGLSIQNKKILNSRGISIKRILPLHVKSNKTFLFHSSYFRYCTNSNSINITTVHDFTVEKYGKGIKRFLHVIQKKRAVKHSKAVICVSDNTKKDFMNFFPWFKGEVVSIKNGYNETSYYFEGNLNKEKTILFIGARTYYKRFDVAVDIVSMLPDFQLLIVGGGELSHEHKRLCDTKLSCRYKKVGFVSNDELREIYNKAFALCYPSEYEGFGIPLLEAQACGCPVICQKVSSIPEVVGDSAIYIDNKNIVQTLDIIKKLQNKNEYNELVNRGLENTKRFSWNNTVKNTYEFYEKIYKMNC